MQRDSLVYVPAAAAYAIVFAASDDGVCEVGLIDPGADDYSLSVPTASVEPMEPAGPESMADLAAPLAVLHLRRRARIVHKLLVRPQAPFSVPHVTYSRSQPAAESSEITF